MIQSEAPLSETRSRFIFWFFSFAYAHLLLCLEALKKRHFLPFHPTRLSRPTCLRNLELLRRAYSVTTHPIVSLFRPAHPIVIAVFFYCPIVLLFHCANFLCRFPISPVAGPTCSKYLITHSPPPSALFLSSSRNPQPTSWRPLLSLLLSGPRPLGLFLRLFRPPSARPIPSPTFLLLLFLFCAPFPDQSRCRDRRRPAKRNAPTRFVVLIFPFCPCYSRLFCHQNILAIGREIQVFPSTHKLTRSPILQCTAMDIDDDPVPESLASASAQMSVPNVSPSIKHTCTHSPPLPNTLAHSADASSPRSFISCGLLPKHHLGRETELVPPMA